MTNTLCLGSHDELYLLDLDRILFLEADDHYTNVQYATGTRFMVPFGLSKVEAAITEHRPDEVKRMMRLGRRYIVNLERVFRINTIKSTLFLFDDLGNNVPIQIPKPVLRSLIDLLRR